MKVTEPLRFFFCRFLLESAAGLFLVCVAAPRLSIWIFTFQKFRLEVLAVKYAPRKVYIKESGGYVELSYTDFCRRRQADKGYMDNTPQTQNAGVGFTRPFRACKTTPAVRKISPIFPTAFTGCNTLHFALQRAVCQTFPLDSLMAGLTPCYPTPCGFG